MFETLRHRYRQAVSRRREAKKRTTRSPQWAHVEKLHLALHPFCAGCGSQLHLQVHHKSPYRLHPERELDPTNLITLCLDTNECHLRIGHGDNFKAYNPNVIADCAASFASPNQRKVIWARAKAARLIV